VGTPLHTLIRVYDKVLHSRARILVARQLSELGHIASFPARWDTAEPVHLRASPCSLSNSSLLTLFHGEFRTFASSTPATLPHPTHPSHFLCTPHISWVAILSHAPMQPSMPTCFRYSFPLVLVHFLHWYPVVPWRGVRTRVVKDSGEGAERFECYLHQSFEIPTLCELGTRHGHFEKFCIRVR
jgi:hypothetical protein